MPVPGVIHVYDLATYRNPRITTVILENTFKYSRCEKKHKIVLAILVIKMHNFKRKTFYALFFAFLTILPISIVIGMGNNSASRNSGATSQRSTTDLIWSPDGIKVAYVNYNARKAG
ncbi:MAG: hypothetical protein RBG13Loki_4366 [Promethearchaeota archaeon CR_4]|nr:MAG: hypothetical protein RBG13Loki_4366 [Candidatus Lokiarchaeota archaeon CR_4]